MFKILTFIEHTTTGFFDIEIEFINWDSPAKQYKTSFRCLNDATRHIQQIETDYLLFQLEHYYNECKTLFELGESRNTETRKLAFDKCFSGIKYLQDKEVTRIAEILLQIKPVLLSMLPAETHPRYSFLYSIFLRLNTFSEKLIINPNPKALCQAS